MNKGMSQHNPADFVEINNYFDHIYVLTIDGSEKRQAALETSLKGLNWEFFYGVHKKNLDMDIVKEQGDYDDQRHLEVKRSNRSMSLSEIACAMSHRAIYQDVIIKNYQRVLILEDDVLPVYQNLSIFSAVANELPDDWELLMLGYYGEKKPTFKYRIQTKIYFLYHYLHLFNWHKVSVGWINSLCLSPYKMRLYTLGKVLGTHAYAVSNAGARKYIDYQDPIIIQADRVFNYQDYASVDKNFAVKEQIFALSELSKESSIQ